MKKGGTYIRKTPETVVDHQRRDAFFLRRQEKLPRLQGKEGDLGAALPRNEGRGKAKMRKGKSLTCRSPPEIKKNHTKRRKRGDLLHIGETLPGRSAWGREEGLSSRRGKEKRQVPSKVIEGRLKVREKPVKWGWGLEAIRGRRKSLRLKRENRRDIFSGKDGVLRSSTGKKEVQPRGKGQSPKAKKKGGEESRGLL